MFIACLNNKKIKYFFPTTPTSLKKFLHFFLFYKKILLCKTFKQAYFH